MAAAVPVPVRWSSPRRWRPSRRCRSSAKGELVEHAEGQHLGRITAFNGQMGMYVRALTYMLSHGGDGLAQAAKDAVLNANYVKARLQHIFSVPFPGQPVHARGAVRRQLPRGHRRHDARFRQGA